MEDITGRDNQIISQALSIAIPIMLRHSLSSSDTMDMLRILETKNAPFYSDRAVKNFVNTVIEDLKAGRTYVSDKNRKDGISNRHSDLVLELYLEKFVPRMRKRHYVKYCP